MLRVLLVQLPVPNNAVTNVPLAAGYLKAYAHAMGLLDRAQIDILPRALADEAGDALLVDAIVERAPDVLGLSLYTWNSERSLDVARRAKQRLPGLVVVVGGPEVQRENEWVLGHPGADVWVFGEGEASFAALVERFAARLAGLPALSLDHVAGVAFRGAGGQLVHTPERPALDDLSVVPSPYLLGYLPLEPGGMQMVEISRWCPYACSFCLYGRNMGAKLGSRYFPLERVLAEIRWGKERGAAQVHFIEANLNLVPLFQPLMAALADLNADGQLALYAELRGEHLREDAVAALAQAGLRVAEVGLQTANLDALRAAHRRTDLAKWAAGTRRLYDHGIEVLLDVIVGLPEDDAQGIRQTLDFIAAERLGEYDAFTLQVLPGTAVRRDAQRYQIAHQPLPPYYVLATDRMDYATMRQLRREVKLGAGVDPDAVEGCPEPRRTLAGREGALPATLALPHRSPPAAEQLAYHVDVALRWEDRAEHRALLEAYLRANPSGLLDLYIHADTTPSPAALRAWRDALPFAPGYLDRVAVYLREQPGPGYERIRPRLWLVVPWTEQIEPDDYAGAAQVIWRAEAEGGEAPLGAWRAAGGAGVWVEQATPEQAARWERAGELRVWHGPLPR
ncbi:B12-binding domain-containing radical SAM protein [Chloroflexia bacterium SDU3-3]|nr:B12-binding domain-containing radical SAM protein [Chloroflexia bacterium SDU3-3]